MLVLSLAMEDQFLAQMKLVNDWILNTFSSTYALVTLFMVFLCFGVLISPLGRVKIGGADAKPLLHPLQTCSIILCSTVAVGILFWGTAEPLYHLTGPPASAGVDADGREAAVFSLRTMYLHWSITPYAIYCVPSLMFALGFYNYRHSFSLSTTLFPLFRDRGGFLGNLIDMICLFALVAGMAASLGAGMLSLLGGAGYFFDFSNRGLMLSLICLAIVLTFVLSSISGLFKGIRTLSMINVVLFFLLLLYVIVFGPVVESFSLIADSLSAYVAKFFKSSVLPLAHPSENWSKSWTSFYWANWMAWAPIAALFLGRIGYGYTVRQFVTFNWIFPALFSIFYMSVFSGATLEMQLAGTADLALELEEGGPENIAYAMIGALPYSSIAIFVFIFTIFLSYVTAADSNTEAMSSLSSTGIKPENPSAPIWIKIVWGLVIGGVALVLTSYSGVDGVKMLSNLGGLPALFLLTASSFCLLYLVVKSFTGK